MKQKISITIDAETLEGISQIVNSGIFRNKSHLIEYATSKLLSEIKEK